MDRAFDRDVPIRFENGLGDRRMAGDGVRIVAPDSFACVAAGALPNVCKIEATIRFDEHTRGCGLMLRVSDDFERAYYIRLEPGRQRLVLDSWPRRGDLPFMVELERPLELRPDRPVEMKLFLEGSICEVYAGGKIAMSARLYDHSTGSWGLFVNEGTAHFSGVRLATR